MKVLDELIKAKWPKPQHISKGHQELPNLLTEHMHEHCHYKQFQAKGKN
jgi:hypothetical protein